MRYHYIRYTGAQMELRIVSLFSFVEVSFVENDYELLKLFGRIAYNGANKSLIFQESTYKNSNVFGYIIKFLER